GDTVVTFSPKGKLLSQRSVPAQIKAPTVALVDSAGVLFVARHKDKTVLALSPQDEAPALVLMTPVLGVALRRVGKVESLYVLTGPKGAVLRIPLNVKAKGERIALSRYPAKGELIEPRVRADGHLYAFSTAEHLVYHFDPRGKFIEALGGGGPSPPK